MSLPIFFNAMLNDSIIIYNIFIYAIIDFFCFIFYLQYTLLMFIVFNGDWYDSATNITENILFIQIVKLRGLLSTWPTSTSQTALITMLVRK